MQKSRVKVYDTDNSPTYYLAKGDTFSIELYNPTNKTVLAKIRLNGKYISQGGVILRPAEDFLDRYLDVAKKFLFDTYTVDDNTETKQAIIENGDLVWSFIMRGQSHRSYNHQPLYNQKTAYVTNGILQGYSPLSSSSSGTYVNTNFGTSFNTASYSSGGVGVGSSTTTSFTSTSVPFGGQKKLMKSTIETGTVEKGGDSTQTFKSVDKSFDYFAFHVTSYKLLPISQKVNTADDINVKRYCTNCAHKLKPTFKFCPACASKI
jgi:hypothetical protein